MKVTKAELMQIIREEVEAYKKVKLLENRKNQILRQLNEMDETVTETKVCSECGRPMEEDSMEEGVVDTLKAGVKAVGKAMGVKSPEQKQAEAIKFIDSQDLKASRIRQSIQHNAEKYNLKPEDVKVKMAQFIAREGTINAEGKLTGIPSFNFNGKDFINTGKITQPYGPMSGKGEI